LKYPQGQGLSHYDAEEDLPSVLVYLADLTIFRGLELPQLVDHGWPSGNHTIADTVKGLRSSWPINDNAGSL
jgi:hypothetical protein